MVFITGYDFGLGYCVSSNLKERECIKLLARGQKALHSFRKIGTAKISQKIYTSKYFDKNF